MDGIQRTFDQTILTSTDDEQSKGQMNVSLSQISETVNKKISITTVVATQHTGEMMNLQLAQMPETVEQKSSLDSTQHKEQRIDLSFSQVQVMGTVDQNISTSTDDTQPKEHIINLPLSQMSGTVESKTTNTVVLQNAYTVQEIFNQANISSTDVRLNIEVHDNKAPIMFGSHNSIIGQVSDCNSEDDDAINTDLATSIARNLIDLTAASLQTHRRRCFVETRAIKSVLATLQKSRIAIISGKIGDGKTTAALEIMNRIHRTKGHIPIQVQSGGMWQAAININCRYIVLIDDIFGHGCFSKDVVEKWRPYLSSIRTCIQNGDIYVIITSRKHILMEAVKCMNAYKDSSLFAKSNIVDLTTELDLNEEEKRDFVEQYVTSRPDRTISAKVIDENLSSAKENETVVISRKTINLIVKQDTVLGFPLMCSMFIYDKDCLCKGLPFFQKLNEQLLKEVEAFYYNDKVKYFTLVYTFLNNNIRNLNVKKLFKMAEKEKELFLEVADKCGVTITAGLANAVKESTEALTGVFFKFNKTYQVYEFINNSVMDAICVIYGQMFSEDVLTHCTDSFICDFVDTDSNIQTVNDIILNVTSESYGLLAERITKILLKDLRRFDSLMPLKDTNFVDNLFNYLEESDNLITLLSTVYKSTFHENHSVIFFSSTNEYFLHKLFEYNISDHHDGQWIHNELNFALEWALRKGKSESAKILIKNGACFADDSLSVAAESGSSALIDDLLSSYEFSAKAKHRGLCASCGRGDIKMAKHLIEENNILPSVRCLIGAVLSNSISLIQYLLTSKPWEADEKNEVFDVACRRGNTAMIQILEENGAECNTNTLSLVLESMNIIALKHVLQKHVSTKEQMTKAINFACSKGRLDIVRTLRDHGGTFNEDSLMKAASSNNEAVLSLVLESYKCSDSQVRDVLHYAMEKGFTDMVKCLEKLYSVSEQKESIEA